MLFKSKPKKTLPKIRLFAGPEILYDGLLKDIPLKEEIILQKSIEFFDDPEPCHIHRSAVRVRLIADLEDELQQLTGSAPGPLLSAWADLSGIDRFLLTE